MPADSTTSIAYYQFQFGTDKQYLGGSGIELVGLVNFLKAQHHQASVRLIPFPPSPVTGRNPWQRLWGFLTQQWRDIRNLLAPDEEVLFFFFPKIPLAGHSDTVKVLLFALVGYGLLALKKRLSGQRVAVLILDLPLEQRLMTQPVQSAQDLQRELARFYDLRQLNWPDRLFTWVERVLFKQADVIVSLSKLMTEHLQRKHGLPADKICPRGRNFYLPSYDQPPQDIQVADGDGLRVFYSGDLVRPTTVANLKRVMRVFRDFPTSHLYVCGQRGDWVRDEAQVLGLSNVHYLGILDYATHDAVARQCDVGLLLYTFAYANLVPTSKYSAYVANGLAVLSANSITLSENIQADQVGQAVPVQHLPEQLERWLQTPEQIESFKKRAQQLSANFFHGSYMQEWFDEIL